MAESSNTLVQREIDTEICFVNEILRDIDGHKEHMTYFVAGVRVAVQSILVAIRAVKNTHREERNQLPSTKEEEEKKEAQEEESHTDPCLKVEEKEQSREEGELSEVDSIQSEIEGDLSMITEGGDQQSESEEEEAEQAQIEEELEEEDPDQSNFSSELRKSLNDTLGDLEKVEKKLIKMDCQEHMAVAARKPSGDSTCYLDLMQEFLTDFRQRLLQFFDEFMCMEEHEVALLQERKALENLSSLFVKSPKKDDSTAKAGKKETPLRTNEEGNIISDAETSQRDATQGSITSDPPAAQEDTDSQAIKGLPDTVKTNSEEDALSTATCTGPSDQLEGTKQRDEKGASSNTENTPPKDTSTSTTKITAESQNSPDDFVVVDDDEEFDYVSPLGMMRMFGTMSQESKIQFPPPSPSHDAKDSLSPINLKLEISPVGGENNS